MPDYSIVAAEAHHLAGEPDVLEPALAANAGAIAGSRASQGFTRAMRDALGSGAGLREHLALAIDMARVSLQGFPVPPGDHERYAAHAAGIDNPASRLARMAWERDRADWGNVCNSCFAYRDESAAMFATQEVRCFDLDLVSPTPGQTGFFQRSKRLGVTVRGDGDGYDLTHAMRDSFHDLDRRWQSPPTARCKPPRTTGAASPSTAFAKAVSTVCRAWSGSAWTGPTPVPSPTTSAGAMAAATCST